MKPKIGVLNSGGDCAGLNAVISAIVKNGYHQYDFVGIHRGLEGLLETNNTMELTRETVRGIAHIGGTILYTTNKGKMGGKHQDGKVKTIDPEDVQKAMNRYHELGLEALIVIGGDGSLSAAMQLQQAGMNIVGVPKTIDNDLKATYRTFGFESAVEIVTESLDRIHTTARSHERIMIVEVMGRNAGWIGLHGGIAGGADVILIPEIPFSYQKILEVVQGRADRGRHETVIVVSEGAVSADGSGPVYQSADPSQKQGEFKLGGISERISAYLSEYFPRFENRVTVLGHLQRGGSPTSDDRILSFLYGSYAMEMVRAGEFGRMVSYDGTSLSSIPLAEAVDGIRLVDIKSDLVRLARKAEISFGD